MVGGSYSDDYLTDREVEKDVFNGVYQKSYGNGGGPKVSIIAKLNPNTGKISKATYITARLDNGKTNSLKIEQIGFKDASFAFQASSASWPPGVGTGYVKMPNINNEDRIDNSFKIYYEMKQDLSEISVAQLLK